jgi:CRP-like cAMP-binding protein
MKRIPRGEYVFHQGKTAETMFLLLDGEVHLIAEPSMKERKGRQATVGALYAVTFFGEQALMNPAPYARAFSARAHSDLTLIELGQYEFGTIRRTSPDLLSNILEGIFQVAAQRLRRANQLVRLLRSSNNAERLIQLVLYFCETSSRPAGKGKEVLLTSDSIRYYLDVDEPTLQRALEDLQTKGLMTPKPEGYWLVSDENALKAAAPDLVDSWNVPSV